MLKQKGSEKKPLIPKESLPEKPPRASKAVELVSTAKLTTTSTTTTTTSDSSSSLSSSDVKQRDSCLREGKKLDNHEKSVHASAVLFKKRFLRNVGTQIHRFFALVFFVANISIAIWIKIMDLYNKDAKKLTYPQNAFVPLYAICYIIGILGFGSIFHVFAKKDLRSGYKHNTRITGNPLVYESLRCEPRRIVFFFYVLIGTIVIYLFLGLAIQIVTVCWINGYNDGDPLCKTFDFNSTVAFLSIAIGIDILYIFYDWFIPQPAGKSYLDHNVMTEKGNDFYDDFTPYDEYRPKTATTNVVFEDNYLSDFVLENTTLLQDVFKYKGVVELMQRIAKHFTVVRFIALKITMLIFVVAQSNNGKDLQKISSDEGFLTAFPIWGLYLLEVFALLILILVDMFRKHFSEDSEFYATINKYLDQIEHSTHGHYLACLIFQGVVALLYAMLAMFVSRCWINNQSNSFYTCSNVATVHGMMGFIALNIFVGFLHLILELIYYCKSSLSILKLWGSKKET